MVVYQHQAFVLVIGCGSVLMVVVNFCFLVSVVVVDGGFLFF